MSYRAANEGQFYKGMNEYRNKKQIDFLELKLINDRLIKERLEKKEWY